MRKKRKYTRRAGFTPVTKIENPYKFVIDSDWVPGKASSNHEYMNAIIDTASSLLSGESFPISMIDLKKLCGYANGYSAASSIRTALRKYLGKDKVGFYGTHVVKDHNGNHVAVRVRKK
jgi:hypothetical protein